MPLGPARPPASAALESIVRLTRNWTEEGSDVAAAELAAGAVTVGLADIPADAIERAASSAHPNVRKLARVILRNQGLATAFDEPPAGVTPESPEPALEIAALKRRLNADPRDAISWTEVARYYAALGQLHRAEPAMRIAVTLAPTNRFILRAAACFYTQADVPDEALAILRRAPNLTSDPWLAAAELAVSAHADQRPKTLKPARALMNSGDHSAGHLSEMVSELATLEMRSGGDRRARKLFERAMIQPTENSLAQVEWASQRIPGLVVPDDALEVPLAAEARTLHARDTEDWAGAVGSATEWLDDQPFSDDAAVVGSYYAAAALRDWRVAENLARRGLRSHPHHVTLINNLAYALLEQGRVDEAARELAAIRGEVADDDQMALAATLGLLRFREGNSDAGRVFYELAIRRARSLRQPDDVAMATILLGREELRVGQRDPRSVVAEATRAGGKSSNPIVRDWLDKLTHESLRPTNNRVRNCRV